MKKKIELKFNNEYYYGVNFNVPELQELDEHILSDIIKHIQEKWEISIESLNNAEKYHFNYSEDLSYHITQEMLEAPKPEDSTEFLKALSVLLGEDSDEELALQEFFSQLEILEKYNKKRLLR